MRDLSVIAFIIAVVFSAPVGADDYYRAYEGHGGDAQYQYPATGSDQPNSGPPLYGGYPAYDASGYPVAENRRAAEPSAFDPRSHSYNMPPWQAAPYARQYGDHPSITGHAGPPMVDPRRVPEVRTPARGPELSPVEPRPLTTPQQTMENGRIESIPRPAREAEHPDWLDQRATAEGSRYFDRADAVSYESRHGLFSDWEVDAGAVLLERRAPRQEGLYFDKNTGQSLFAAGDLNMGFAGGPLIRAERSVNSWLRAEGLFYGINTWDYQFSAAGNIGGLDLYNRDFRATGVTLDYQSKLYNVELNAKADLGEHWTVFCGYRWLEMTDHANIWIANMDITGVGAVGNSLYNAKAVNTFNGFQIGLENRTASWWNWHMETDLKVGIFSDQATVSMNYQSASGPSGLYNAKSERAGFIGEMGMQLVWRPFEHFSGFLGYEVLWIDPAVMTVNQLHNQAITHEQVLFNDSAVYHGVRAGLRAKW